MAGIDTPEKRIHRDSTLLEKECGIAVGKYLRDMIGRQYVIVEFETSKEKEKYGRRLGTIYLTQSCCGKQIKGMNINQHLIERGFAKPYDGGSKDTFTKSDLTPIWNTLVNTDETKSE